MKTGPITSNTNRLVSIHADECSALVLYCGASGSGSSGSGSGGGYREYVAALVLTFHHLLFGVEDERL